MAIVEDHERPIRGKWLFSFYHPSPKASGDMLYLLSTFAKASADTLLKPHGFLRMAKGHPKLSYAERRMVPPTGIEPVP